MSKDKKKKIIDVSSTQVGEDATKYGEFISSYFDWNTLSEQKKKVKRLESITKENDKQDKK